MYNISQTNIFKNWDKDCYIASLLPPTLDEYENELNTYEEPIKYKFNYQPVTDQREFATLEADGININGVQRALLDLYYLDKIKVYDLAYLNEAIPYVLTEDETYKENVVYYKKENNGFVQLIVETDYNVGDTIEGNIYNKEISNGANANYKVVKFVPQNVKILVYFERLF